MAQMIRRCSPKIKCRFIFGVCGTPHTQLTHGPFSARGWARGIHDERGASNASLLAGVPKRTKRGLLALRLAERCVSGDLARFFAYQQEQHSRQ